MPKKAIDLIGQQFGELVVVERDLTKPTGNGHHAYWICQCSCGKIISVSSNKLRRGNQKSCGHLNLVRQNLIGRIFDKLTIIDYSEELDGKGQPRLVCQCECGNIVTRSVSSLYAKKISSCDSCRERKGNFAGISEKEEKQRVGQRFGKLIVIKATDKRYQNGEKYYLCQCDCGNTTLARWSSLISGRKNSCGCLKSKGELKIENILKENNYFFKEQYSFDNLISRKGRKLKFDFAIFEENKLKCLIEYQGEQHYRKESRFYDEEAQERDSLKRKYCFENNINLIEIPYTDYNKLNYNYLISLGV